MGKVLIIILVIAIAVFVLSVISIFILINKKKILTLKYKMEISEQTINENLKAKLDLIIRAINIIEREAKIESKKFEEVKKIKSDKMNNIIVDNLLNEAANEIINIKNDYKELSNTKSFDGIINDIKNLDILLIGGRKFYNKYAISYNKQIKVFPNNLFKKTCSYKNLFSDALYDQYEKIDFIV